MAKYELTTEETAKFLSRISPEPMSGCFLWTSYLNDAGYGIFSLWRNGKEKKLRAHCVYYDMCGGIVPEGMELDHLCCCVNPKHLDPKTHPDNCRCGIGGQVAKARHAARTHCKRGHPFDEANTIYVHIKAKNGKPARIDRQCRICRLERGRKADRKRYALGKKH